MAEWDATGAVVGVVGGGQLGRMLGEAGTPLGIELVILDPTADAPANIVARDQLVAEFDDEEAIESLATVADVLTYEIELADPDGLEQISNQTGTPVHPHPATLRMIQDKLRQKEQLQEAGIPVPPFRRVDTAEELVAACETFGTPTMVKARTGGYDGRGNLPITDVKRAAAVLAELNNAPAMAESFVDFERELSVIGVKSDDTVETYIAAENVHEAEILRETVVPARTSSEVHEKATQIATEVMQLLPGRGVFGIELFETATGKILVNEIAPRPHNSGHWTIEGAVTSQFEQHLRAILGLPLGSTALRSPIVTANVLGDGDQPRPADPVGIDSVLKSPVAKLHWYGKHEVRPLRKMGHVAVHQPDETDAESLLSTARSIIDEISFA